MLGLCATRPSACTASPGSNTNLAVITDAATSTGFASIALSGGVAWFEAALPSSAVRRVVVRGTFAPTAPVQVQLRLSSGQLVNIGSLNSTVSYAYVPLIGPWEGLAAVRLSGAASFSLQELAVSAAPCTEQASVDLGAAHSLSSIRCARWS